MLLTLPPKNVPLAECFNASKENGNDEDSAGALHAGVQAGSCAVGERGAEHRGGGKVAGCGGAEYAFREPILRKELRRDRGRGYETTLADATGFDAGRQL